MGFARYSKIGRVFMQCIIFLMILNFFFCMAARLYRKKGFEMVRKVVNSREEAFFLSLMSVGEVCVCFRRL